MLNLIEQIKTECLFAFCHARIKGEVTKEYELKFTKKDKSYNLRT